MLYLLYWVVDNDVDAAANVKLLAKRSFARINVLHMHPLFVGDLHLL